MVIQTQTPRIVDLYFRFTCFYASTFPDKSLNSQHVFQIEIDEVTEFTASKE